MNRQITIKHHLTDHFWQEIHWLHRRRRGTTVEVGGVAVVAFFLFCCVVFHCRVQIFRIGFALVASDIGREGGDSGWRRV